MTLMIQNCQNFVLLSGTNIMKDPRKDMEREVSNVT